MQIIDLARELISTYTVSEAPTTTIANRLSDILESAGFTIDHHTYTVGGIPKVNVVARKGPHGLPEVALTGHMDTVPFDPSEWRSDPLKLTERDGKLFGRGACDMKAFIALATAVGSRIPAADLKHPFALIFTSDEEVGCIGARRLIKDRGQLARRFVIGEPTGMVPFHMHKGYIYLKIRLLGRGGHSSRPDEGINVVSQALPPVITRINEFAEALQQVRDDRFDPPYPTLNIGVVRTGENAAKNTIAEEAVVELDIRPVPRQRVEDIVYALEHHIAPDGSVNGVSVRVDLARSPTVPFETARSADIVELVEGVMEAPSRPTSFNTEGGVFNSTGGASVVCGLGHIAQAHKPNEYVDASFLSENTADLFERIIRRICT